MLKENKTLTELNMSNNNIGDEGASALKEALKLNTTLTTLDINDSSITISKEILDQIAILIDRNRKSFIKNAPYVINNILAKKQPDNEFFNSLIEEGKRLQNLTLNQDIKTLLLNNGSLKNNKKLLTKDKEQKKDMDIVVKYINSLSADEKRELKTDINKLNIEEVRDTLFLIPFFNYIHTIDNDDIKDKFIDDYIKYLDTNTDIRVRLPLDIWEHILKYLDFNEIQTFVKAITI